MKFQAIKRTRVYEEVVKQLKDLITSGGLKPGDKLPPERELADQFNVSRVSIRQALTVLETLGLIERKVGGGTFSVADQKDFDIDPLVENLLTKKDQLNQPLEVRRILEPNLAKLAAERAEDQDIEKLEQSLEKQKKLIDQNELIIEEDNNFHFLIAKTTKNDIALKILETINDMLLETREESIKAEQGSELSFKGHQRIFEAISGRDSEAAFEAMVNHLEDVETLIMSHLANRK